MNDKNRKIAIIIAAILGCVGLFYLGGMLGQLLGNYAAWMDSGGVSGESTMKPVSWNPLICFPAAFSDTGIKGILMILLIAGAIFGGSAWVSTSAYFIGMAAIIVSGIMLKKTKMFSGEPAPFVMELPPYRVPTMRATLSHMWDRCAQYLRKMGGLILIASVAVWFLSYYPTPDAAAPAETMEEHYENSYLGQVGQACSPVFEPLGLNWKASIAILTGLPAKEIVVSTLGVLYSEQGDAPEAELDSPTLSQRLVASGDFTPASALAFLVFILLYLPCIATIVAIAAEIGWRWACISVLYNTALAWIMAYLTYHLFSWL